MMREMLKSKLHNARVVDIKLEYSGSLSIDKDLMKKANIIPYEKVDVYNINNGHRFSTYAIPAEKGMICVNGAAARLAMPGDRIIIVSYCYMNDEELKKYKPIVLILDENNNITKQ
jgi:aspartate 1-decarboxylase